MTTHTVPTVTLRDEQGHFFVVLTRHNAEGETTTNELPLPGNITTTFSAEQIVEMARGALADAFHAGREEGQLEPTTVGTGSALVAQRDEAIEQRDAMAESVEQLRRDLEQSEAHRDEVLQERVEQLTREIEGHISRINALQDNNSRWERTVAIIGERLIEEAQRRDWCSEYDSFVESLNTSLPIGELPTRIVEYTASLIIEVSFDCRRNEDAYDIASELSNALYRLAYQNLTGHEVSVRESSTDNVYEA
jgi:hypothetical protein